MKRPSFPEPWPTWRAGLLLALYVVFFPLEMPLPPPLAPSSEGWLSVVERPFRMRQSWGLYASGAGVTRKLEIRVDGRPVYRSVDPELTWMSGQLQYRRVRPLVGTSMITKSPKNWKGLVRYVAARAREDFPGCRRVDLITLLGPLPGTDLAPERQFSAEAPDWEPFVAVAPSPVRLPGDEPSDEGGE